MKYLLFLMFLASPVGAQLAGRLDLGSPPRGLIMRDVDNGQWRGGYSKSLYNVRLKDLDLFYLGYNHTWNAERGNSALGLGLGKQVTLSQLGTFGTAVLSLPEPNMPPFIKYVGNVVSFEGDLAYMPFHTADVDGPIIYGFGFQLDLTDMFSILSKGL